MGAAAIGIGAVTAGLSAFSAIQQGQAESNNATYQAQVAQNNADIARQNEAEERRAGMLREQAEIYKVRGMVGEQEAQQGASGVDVNGGSQQTVRDSTRFLGSQSIANVRDESGRRAAGFSTQATGFENDASNLKTAASNAETSGWINAGAAVIGGVSDGFGKYADMKKDGVPMWDASYLIP